MTVGVDDFFSVRFMRELVVQRALSPVSLLLTTSIPSIPAPSLSVQQSSHHSQYYSHEL